jgi:hypothetical protein
LLVGPLTMVVSSNINDSGKENHKLGFIVIE